MTKPRLTRARWIQEGLAALRDEGPVGLAAEKLARRLSVSRGSFYWHFDSAADFEAAVLGEWEERWTEAFIQQVEAAGGDSRDRLSLLVLATSREDASLYSAAKQMARRRPELREMLMRVDERRLTFVAELLVAAGISREEALLRARIVYAWAMGQMLISGGGAPVTSEIASVILEFALRPNSPEPSPRRKICDGS